MTDKQKDIIKAMIEVISDLPIGCEALEGYWDTDDIHNDWNEFMESIKDHL